MRAAIALLALTACAHRGVEGARALSEEHLTVGGLERRYLWARPADPACPAGPLPAVIALHGRYGDGAGMERLTHLAELGDRGCFVAVFPDGYERSWNDARGVGPAADAGIDDQAFLAALVDRVVAAHGVDPARVYLMGMSNGAMMGLTAACATGTPIAGVAAVAGLVPEPLAAPGRCAPRRPLAVVLIAGTADAMVPFAGGAVAETRGRVLSAEASAALWARALDCPDPPARAALPERDPDDGTRVRVARWTSCADGGEVALLAVEGGGHAWPGGWRYMREWLVGRTSGEIDAGEVAWSILREQPRAPLAR